MKRTTRSVSPPRSPIDPRDRSRELEPAEDRRAGQEASRSPPSTVRAAVQGTSTSLPPIRNLHLPPPQAPRHAVPAQQYSPEFLPSASYASPTFFAGSQRSPALASAYPPPAYSERRMSFDRPLPATHPQPSSSTYPDPRVSPHEAESDQEQNDSERGPPKKKRRRQALSCTECKRRKIKCDRMHPCGPCARRSEPEKCQWHVIEPVDKYVTRSELEDLAAKYRMLEERFVRLESIVVQLHPELAESPTPRYATTVPSPRAPHPIATRQYPISGPGMPGPSNSGLANQRVTPHTPVSALPGPSPGSRHGPGPSVSALPPGPGTGTESAASARSGSAPPPMLATTQAAVPHHPPHSDRRTSASGSRASFPAPSERSVPLQVSETGRGRPFTAPTSHSYSLPAPPPPPPPEETPPGYSLSRRHSYSQGRSAVVPETSSLSSPMQHGTRLHRRSYPSPMSAVSSSGHMQVDDTSAELIHEEIRGEHHRHYDPDTRRERSISHERREPLWERDTDSKNGKAQVLEADDALRYHWSASPACNAKTPFSTCHRTEIVEPDLAVSPVSRPNSGHTYSGGGSGSSSPSPDSAELSRSSRKRLRSGNHVLNLPACGSAPETPPPAVIVH